MKSVTIVLLSFVLVAAAGCAKKPTIDTAPVATAHGDGSEANRASQPAVIAGVNVNSKASGEIAAPASIYFDFDSFTLSPSARQILQRNAAWLQENPAVRVTIEGHADERGSDAYNIALGERRAAVAKDFLVTLGIEPSRLATISYGEEKPAVEGGDERAWALNRRGEFVTGNL